MKQRVCLALSFVLEPSFVLLDESTTGLDVVVQRSILQNLKELQQRLGFSVLIISHDLGAIMEVSDRAAVMYNGQIVDTQPACELLEHPKHPYSNMLLDAYRELWVQAGESHDSTSGQESGEGARRESLLSPPAKTEPVVMTVTNLGKTFSRRRGLKASTVVAVDDISSTLERGKITALVEQSGSD